MALFIDTNMLVQARFASARCMAQAIADVLEFRRAFAILLDLCRDVPVGGRRVHDANIVATLLAHGERRLLTFNDSDFMRFVPRIEIVRP